MVLPRLRTSFEILARANGTPTEELDRAWEEVQLSVAKGGSNIGGHADVADACFVAAFLAVWPSLRDRPAYQGHALAGGGAPPLVQPPLLVYFNKYYNSIRDRCIKLWGVYRARAKHVDFGMVNNYNLGYYRPSGLPLVSKMPPVSDLYSEQSTSPVPKQGTLAQIASHERWLRCLAACEQLDAEMDDPNGVKHREASRFIAVCQFASGAWLDLCPDGRHSSKITSEVFATALQRRHGYYISCAKYVYDAKEAAGETVTIGMRKGDQLANGSKDIPCEHNIRHNGTMYATANMVRARACGKLVLGDKANPQTTFHLNEGHVTDMCEIGGDLQSQRDVHYEVKVPSALTKTRQAGQGSAAHGGCCASLGHKFGFGSTLDQTLLKVLGCKERGHKSQGPLVHATGKGWVKEHKGQYYDALHVKNGIVKICLVESQGGIAPPTKRIIFNFAKEVGSPSAVDRTDYGTASGSARGFAQHHSQQLSRAAVCGDAQNINNAARNMRVAHSFMTGLNAPPPCARAF